MFIPLAHQIRYLTKASVSSKYRVEPENIKSNDDDILIMIYIYIYIYICILQNVKM